ncbi:hypothetical protein UNH65_19580 [Chitinophaga sp. 180180018-2]|nr:hypothetical protein [Chitinophaga sp. 212800010-3]
MQEYGLCNYYNILYFLSELTVQKTINILLPMTVRACFLKFNIKFVLFCFVGIIIPYRHSIKPPNLLYQRQA